MGGFHLGQSRLEESDAIKLFHATVDSGINFSDNSWDYNQGESEGVRAKLSRAIAIEYS
jgi:aryl-alcohol dehydrogenase-like predicted oxidoreductase